MAGAAMTTGVFALILGGVFSFGGPPEASASVVFSLWLVVSVVLAVRAVRRGDIVRHRRWMIRAFAVGPVRIWLGLFEGLGLLDLPSAWGPAFWVGMLIFRCTNRDPIIRACALCPSSVALAAFLRGLVAGSRGCSL